MSRRRKFDSSQVVTVPAGACGWSEFSENAGYSRSGGLFHDRKRELLVVVDWRLDNRRELSDLLGDVETDGHLIGQAYERWGPSFPDRICGDFALVIWDIKKRMLYAARDPFGVKTLYFSNTASGLLVANDVEMLVAQVDRHRIDPEMVLDYLTTSFGHYRRTFFRDINRLQPGHYLVSTAASSVQVRYFFPPKEDTYFSSAEDYQQEFKRLLTQSIIDRLKTPRPVVAHLSGGLDSTSIVLLADDIYKTDSSGLPPLTTASAVFPGLDCDESAIIRATHDRVSFPGEEWVGYDSNWEHLDNPTVAWPGSPSAILGGNPGDLAIAKRLGATVILSGGGGDEVSRGADVFRDMAAAGQWMRLLKETVGPPQFRWRYSWAYLRDSAVGLVPSPLRRLRQRLRPTRAGVPPNWLGPALNALWPGGEDAWDDFGWRWDSWVQRGTWRALATATTSIPIDYRNHYGTEAGLEIRFPFLDRRLVNFVLSVPWQYRLPGGFLRRLQWKALEDRLPREILARKRIVPGAGAVIRQGQNGLPRFRRLVDSAEWASGEYVKQDVARNLLSSASLGMSEGYPSLSRAWHLVQRMMAFEAWLRGVFRYIGPSEE